MPLMYVKKNSHHAVPATTEKVISIILRNSAESPDT